MQTKLFVKVCLRTLLMVFVCILSGCVDELFITKGTQLTKDDLKPLAGHYYAPTMDKKYATLRIGSEIEKHAYATNRSCDALAFEYGFGENKPQITGIACFSRLPGSDLIIMASPGEKTTSYGPDGKGSVLGKDNNPFVLLRLNGYQLEIWAWDKSNPLVAQSIMSSRWSSDPLQTVHSFLVKNWQKYVAEQEKITLSRSTEIEERTIESMLAAESKQQQLAVHAAKIQENKLKLEKELAELKSPKTGAQPNMSARVENEDVWVNEKIKIVEIHKPVPGDLSAPIFTIETDSGTAAMLNKQFRSQFQSQHTKLLGGKLYSDNGKSESRAISIYASMPRDNVYYAYSLFLYEEESDCTFPVSSPHPTERTKVFWQATIDYQSKDQIDRQINMLSTSDKSKQWKAWPDTGKCKPERSIIKPELATRILLDFALRSPSKIDLEVSKEAFSSSPRTLIGKGSFSHFDKQSSLFSRSMPLGGMDDPEGHYFVTSSIIGKISVVGMNFGDYEVEITQVHATDWSRLSNGELFASGYWKPEYQRLVLSEYDRTKHCGIVSSELISHNFIPAKFNVSSDAGWQLSKSNNDEAICMVTRLVDCKIDGCLKWSTHEDFSNRKTYIVKTYEEAQILFNNSKKVTKYAMPPLQ